MQNTYKQQEKVTSHTVFRNPHSYRSSFKEPVVPRGYQHRMVHPILCLAVALESNTRPIISLTQALSVSG